MAGQRHSKLLVELGLAKRQPPELFRSAADVADAPLSGYTHVLRRTWDSFTDLTAILAVDTRPTVFLEEFDDDVRIKATQQQRFWSQGVAPLLVRVSPKNVHIYTGLRTPALNDEEVDDNERLVETFQGAARILELRDFLRSVEAGTVYGRYAKKFDPTQSVDQRLVQNLRDVRERMADGASSPDLASIHRVLGRVLFTCYLEARGALLEKDFGGLGAGAAPTFKEVLSLSEPQAVRAAMGKLFGRLGRHFRGDLFVAEELHRDLKALRDNDIVALGELVSGTEVATGQKVLPFYVYDFSVIPIETISAVYEDFIRAEDPKAQRQTGAYYTPPKLVEFTCDLATKEDPDLTGKHVLDPACGSGVFLVSAFNRMAEAWCRKYPDAENGKRASELARILREQICGVDVSLIACQATCFSLYMAMLDFLKPPEIRKLPDRLPDLLLSDGEKLRKNGPRTVVEADFLSAPPAIESRRFDLILGNPPWVSREKLKENEALDRSMRRWESEHSASQYPTPARQVACAFMWEAAPYLRLTGHACLLLPAGVLIGDQTDAFQAAWFKRYGVDKVAHLSDLRHFLFPKATHPTVAVRFAGASPTEEHRLEYLTPKASHAMLNDNVLAVEPDDRKFIALAELLRRVNRNEAATFWLSYNWASPRDLEFLLRLRDLPPLSELAGKPREHKRWIRGEGFKPPGEKTPGTHTPFWDKEASFLDARHSFDLLLGPSDVLRIDPSIQKLHRAPDERLFEAPLVVFNQGFTKAAFSPFDVLFKHAIHVVSGPRSDANLLRFLTASLLSPLAGYFAFHLTSKAIYRDRALFAEILRFPFPLPEDAPGREAKRAVLAVSKVFDSVSKDKRLGSLGYEQLISDAKKELTEYVYSYFDVSADERILIEDTVGVFRRSATRNRDSTIPTLATPTKGDRETYATTLLDTLHAWAGGSGGPLGAQCVLSEQVGVAVLTISRRGNARPYGETNASEALDKMLSRLREISPERYGSLVYLRNLAVFDGDQMHIVKPLTMRYWLRSAALNDADTAAAHLLTHRQQRARA